MTDGPLGPPPDCPVAVTCITRGQTVMTGVASGREKIGTRPLSLFRVVLVQFTMRIDAVRGEVSLSLALRKPKWFLAGD